MANPQNIEPYKWQPGESGNPGGRPRKLPALDQLLENILGDERDGVTAAESILRAIRQQALKGNLRAAEILLDRAYGKPLQKTEISAGTGLNVTVSISDKDLQSDAIE